MNVRFQYTTAFNAGSWFEDELVMSTYQLSIKLVTDTMDPTDQNIALERIKHFLLAEIHSTIFISQEEMERAEAFTDLGLNVTTLPEQPVDQVVGIMLFHKLNAIMEGRLRITEIVLSSDAGDNIEYFHSDAEHTDLFPSTGWWHLPTPLHSDVEYEDDETGSNVVAIDSADAWRELELAWNNTDIATDIGQVVFANFNNNETKH